MFNKTISIASHGIALMLMLIVGFSTAGAASNTGRHQVIDGVSIYLGILPVQMAKSEADELNLPAKVYTKKDDYYVLFAMFDAKSGRRITDAQVKARVMALGGLDFSEKKLAPIHIEKLISYGNYFRLADPDLYHIQVWITLAGSSQPLTGTFDYQRPAN